MNSSERVGNKQKTKVMKRVIQAKQMLMERGFNATYIETEDVHLKRRSFEAIDEKR
jgi:DUF2075 family protein